MVVSGVHFEVIPPHVFFNNRRQERFCVLRAAIGTIEQLIESFKIAALLD